MVTITDVRMTPDLHEATVFWTVWGDEQTRADSAAALESAKGLSGLRSVEATGLKHTPSIAFVLDAVPENAHHIEELLAKARDEDERVHRAAEGAKPAGSRSVQAEPFPAAQPAISPVTAGLVVVDKPAGCTSHDVVARLRRLAGTRRVGHAGTLDPMATGVLVVGIGQATRLLGHLALGDKDYAATIRLGMTTTTDDADGEELETRDADGVSDAAISEAISHLTGDIEQVPSAVSAIKVDGVRSYQRVRDGETVALKARRVQVAKFDLVERRGDDIDVHVTCSTGTYVRALARDIGCALGVGGHLTALRRSRVGGFTLDEAKTLEQLEQELIVVPLAAAVDAAFARVDVTEEEAVRIGHGQRLALDLPGIPTGVFAPDGRVVALVEDRDGVAQPLCVFT